MDPLSCQALPIIPGRNWLVIAPDLHTHNDRVQTAKYRATKVFACLLSFIVSLSSFPVFRLVLHSHKTPPEAGNLSIIRGHNLAACPAWVAGNILRRKKVVCDVVCQSLQALGLRGQQVDAKKFRAQLQLTSWQKNGVGLLIAEGTQKLRPSRRTIRNGCISGCIYFFAIALCTQHPDSLILRQYRSKMVYSSACCRLRWLSVCIRRVHALRNSHVVPWLIHFTHLASSKRIPSPRLPESIHCRNLQEKSEVKIVFCHSGPVLVPAFNLLTLEDETWAEQKN